MHHMAEHIHQSNMVEGIYSDTEDRRSMEVWLWLRAQVTISHEVICALQGRIVAGQHDLAVRHKGQYRDVNVRVGGHSCPPWQLVRNLMDEWLALRRERSAWDNHCAFEDIHPFADGNGRTGRMLLWHEQVTAAHPQAPTLIVADQRQRYYDQLNAWRDSYPASRRTPRRQQSV